MKPRSETDNVNYIDLDQWKSHFEGIYTSSDVTDNVSLYKDEEITNLEQDSEENVLLSRHFTIGEIKKHIKLLKNNKSAGSDMILDEMIKCGSNILSPVLCKLFNIVLNTGIFPQSWNETYQVPLYKSGDPSQCNNYRGIAIDSCLGKLFTNILKTRLLRYVEDENKFNDSQSAFRKCRCMSDHLFTIKSILNKYLKSLKKRCFLLLC